jgi:hypothetical protein
VAAGDAADTVDRLSATNRTANTAARIDITTTRVNNVTAGASDTPVIRFCFFIILDIFVFVFFAHFEPPEIYMTSVSSGPKTYYQITAFKKRNCHAVLRASIKPLRVLVFWSAMVRIKNQKSVFIKILSF